MSKAQTATDAPTNLLIADAEKDRLLTIRQVSEITGLAVGSLYHLAADGRIPTTRLSRRCLRFRLSELRRWWDERSHYPTREEKRQKR